MNEGKSGDVVECILALGYLYQTNKCDAMKGIMELVVYLENMLMQSNNIANGSEQAEIGDMPITTAEFQEAIMTLKDKIDKLRNMNSKLMNDEMEETSTIRMAMQQMMDKMKAWTKKQYPDRDRLKEERLAEDERSKHNEEIAAQARKKEQDEQNMSWEEKRRAEDIRDMNSHQLSETGSPWNTDLTYEQMGDITAWVRTMPVASTALGYTVRDETIFTKEEMEHSEKEKTTQLQFYDALIGGCHGNRIEKKQPGYRFELEMFSRHGWVPHGAIYGWLRTNTDETMTTRMFWNMVLHTRSNHDNAHSYMVKYWPSMKIVFVKAVRTVWQMDAQKRKREQQEEQAG
eukprot:3071356-Heterocapsa_arctica.AAC.1